MWKNKTCKTSTELMAFMNTLDDIKKEDVWIIQDMMGYWHLIYMGD